MKHVLLIMVLVGMTGGAYAMDFSDLQAVKASDIKGTAMVPPQAISAKALNTDMLDSSKNAHLTTWTTLIILNYIPRVAFTDAGGLSVNDGQDTMSGHMLAAQKIDEMFVKGSGAKRVENMAAIPAIAKALSERNISVKDFANLMHTLYVFWGEHATDAVVVPQEAINAGTQDSDIMDRSSNAHLTTWTTLITLNYIPRIAFADAGGLSVNDGQDTMAGHMLAAQKIDDIFVKGSGAKRVGNMAAIPTIAKALSAENVSVKDFANLMHTLYVFWGE